METIFIAALILGLTSNFHCIGMCGPIALAIPVNRRSVWTISSGVLQYNTGRILTYALLGALIGNIGISINTLGLLQWLSIITGIFMIGYAWRKWLSTKISASIPLNGLQSFISSRMGKVLSSQTTFKLTFLGMLNGLLPCGMVYLAMVNALLSGSSLSSALAMALFGLGTLPAMLIVGFAANKISQTTRQKMNKAVPYLLTLVGLLVVLRGLNLDIPYISPKIKLTRTLNNKTSKVVPEANMSCCHNKANCKK